MPTQGGGSGLSAGQQDAVLRAMGEVLDDRGGAMELRCATLLVRSERMRSRDAAS